MTSEEPRIDDVTRTLIQVAGVLFSEETVQSALDRICLLAHETIPGTAGAGVTLVRGNSRSTAAYSEQEPVLGADERQYELNEGPCLSSYEDKAVYRIDSMPDRRWPRWSASAGGMGLASMVSVPLLVRDQAIGAMKVYSREEAHYGERDERVLTMFVEQASIVLSNVLEYSDARAAVSQVKQAIAARDLIGIAKGILMEREAVDEMGAFAMLRSASQDQGIELREIARSLIDEASRRGAS